MADERLKTVIVFPRPTYDNFSRVHKLFHTLQLLVLGHIVNSDSKGRVVLLYRYIVRLRGDEGLRGEEG